MKRRTRKICHKNAGPNRWQWSGQKSQHAWQKQQKGTVTVGNNNTSDVLGITYYDDWNIPPYFGTHHQRYYQNKHPFFTGFKDRKE